MNEADSYWDEKYFYEREKAVQLFGVLVGSFVCQEEKTNRISWWIMRYEAWRMDFGCCTWNLSDDTPFGRNLYV